MGLPDVARKNTTGSKKCGKLQDRRHILREMNRTENDAGVARAAELRFYEESSSEAKVSLSFAPRAPRITTTIAATVGSQGQDSDIAGVV